MIFNAVVWHWWIAPLLLAGGLLLLAATVAGYLRQVVRPRFPPKGFDPKAPLASPQAPQALEGATGPEAVEGAASPAALGQGPLGQAAETEVSA